MHKIRFGVDALPPGEQAVCPLCQSPDCDPLLTVETGHFLTHDLVMVTCRSCGSAYFLGDDPVIGYDYAGFNEDYWHNYVQNGAGITAMLEPLLALDRPRRGDVLDIGCGFGFVPHFWTQMGYGDAVGLEKSRYGVVGRQKLGVKILHDYYRDAQDIAGRRFDYVFSSEVLEHVPDPAGFLAEIGQALADDGILILTTPSAKAVTPDTAYTTLIATLSPGFHYFIASQQALTDLLRKAGYPHVLVRDSGERLFAWASHKPLPKITEGFRDWRRYLDYLATLSGHEDTHIAGGASYRLLKDSLNLGEMERARAIYPRFEALARDGYGLDMRNPRASESWRRERAALDNARYPSWMGCGFYFAGLYLSRTGGDLAAQLDLFEAAVETMQSELDLAAQFAMEAAYFLPFAQDCLTKVRRALYGSEILTTTFAQPVEALADTDVCLLSIYAPGGEIGPCTRQYIKTLSESGIAVIACIAVDDPAIRIDLGSDHRAAGVVTRRNSGFDFGMWSDVLRSHPGLLRARRLFLANDSVLVIPPLFDALIARVRASDSDLIALTECTFPCPHTQSYFFVLQNGALGHPDVLAFWERVENLADKTAVIAAYELRFSETLRQTGTLTTEVLFDRDTLFPGAATGRISDWNPTHFFWDRLNDRGFPFVKLELLRDNPMGIQLSAAYALLETYGADVRQMRAHVAGSRARRGHVVPVPSKRSGKPGLMATLREMNRARLRIRRMRRGDP